MKNEIMKTAIQQLVEWIETDLQRIKHKHNIVLTEDVIKNRCQFFMEIEKRIIIDFCKEINKNSLNQVDDIVVEQYYKETFES